MSWFLRTVVLEFVWGKLAAGFVSLYRRVKEYFVRRQIAKENNAQADRVEEIAAEMIRLRKAGMPVPPDLEKRLREESRKLISSRTRPG